MTTICEASQIAGAILAGGASRRMGVEKATVQLRDGRALIEHVVDALASFVGQIVVVGAQTPITNTSRPVTYVADLRKGCGPLAGIEALLASNRASAYLVAACDQPLLMPQLLQLLLEAAVQRPEVPVTVLRCDNQRQPLPAVWRPTALHAVRKALNEGQHRLQDVTYALSPTQVWVSPEFFATTRSMNTPTDLIAAGLLDVGFEPDSSAGTPKIT